MFHVNHPEPGAEIHYRDPFASTAAERSPARRLRGRLAAPVTLWTVGTMHPAEPTPGTDPAGPARTMHPAEPARGAAVPLAGLTVSSTVLVDGEPPRLIGLLDEESQLWEVLQDSHRFAVTPLGPSHRQLADRFAGLMPAPGGPFKGVDWRFTEHGPVLATATSWAGCRLDDARPFGWSMLIEATVESVTVGDEPDAGPLIHYRGRYRQLADPTGPR
ncbi:flavin reductase family protein [Micromonospora sp. NBC_01813]|nr:flavin reductase family protein [Micromonospora sp. NBC_01813]WSA07647.1 flavin reductase family protein [Micromonospora sp. NBC_01813]